MKSEQKVIRLYGGQAPGSESWTHSEQENFSQPWQTQVVFNVVDPTLTLVAPAAGTANGTAIVICPGGGFHALSIESEGFGVARWLAAKGVTCCVLKYRLAECRTDDPASEQAAKSRPDFEAAVQSVIGLAMADAQAALAHVRSNADGYGVDANRIGIIGFSAGGITAASTAYSYTPASRPDFVAPIYAVYNWLPDKRVPADAPPMFLAAATDDPLGLAPHSVSYYNDWTAAQKPVELHLYSVGGHGFGMRKQNLPSDSWIERFGDWLGVQGFLDQ